MKKKKIVYSRGYVPQGYSATQDDIKDRLEYAMNPYYNITAYGLIRKKIWEEGWGKIQKFSCPDVPEAFQAIQTYLSGKYITTEQLFWLRSDENPPISNDSWDRRFRFYQWWQDKSYKSEQDKFLSNLLKIKNIETNLDKNNLNKILLRAINSFVDFQSPKYSFFIRKLFKLIQKFKLFFLALFKVDENSYNKSLAFLNDYKISNELKDIEKLLKEFYDFKK